MSVLWWVEVEAQPAGPRPRPARAGCPLALLLTLHAREQCPGLRLCPLTCPRVCQGHFLLRFLPVAFTVLLGRVSRPQDLSGAEPPGHFLGQTAILPDSAGLRA